jgi:hypothetical protein
LGGADRKGSLVRRPLLVLVPVLGAGLLLAGCELLGTGAFGDGLGDTFGEPLATYTAGRATIEIDGTTIVLDQLSAGPHLMAGFGADVYWFNEDGWGLRLSSYGGGPISSSDITIDRVRTTYWSAPGYGDCIVTVDTIDPTGVKGSATCDGLRWTDQLRGGTAWSADPRYVEGEPAFDATVTFEAEATGPGRAAASPNASPTPSAG